MWENWVIVEHHADGYGRTEHWFDTLDKAWEYIDEYENSLQEGYWYDMPEYKTTYDNR